MAITSQNIQLGKIKNMRITQVKLQESIRNKK